MATPPTSPPQPVEGELPDFADTERRRARLVIFVFVALSGVGACTCLLLSLWLDESLVTRALWFSAAALWLAAAGACGYARFALNVNWRSLQREGPEDTANAAERVVASMWRRVTVVLGVAAIATGLMLVALGFTVLPNASASLRSSGSASTSLNDSSGRPGHSRSTLGISWTVETPLQVATPATARPFAPSALVVIRVADPARPACSGGYAWRIERRGSKSIDLNSHDTCTLEVRLEPETDYEVHVARIGPAADTSGRAGVRIRRVLIASFGDSVASGEGNPAAGRPKWEDRSLCSRSAIAGPRQAAELVSAAVDHAVVVFFHVACTGAWIDGVGAPRSLGSHPTLLPRLGQEAPSEVEQFERFERGAPEADLLVLLSVGANDVGFGPILKRCFKTRHCYDKKLGGLRLDQLVESRLAQLLHSYDRLAVAAPFRSARVFVTEYFDPLHDMHGRLCRISLVPGVLTISRDEAEWAERAIIERLNELVQNQAKVRNWQFVSGIAAAFRPHGYCARDSWIVHVRSALVRWNLSGPFHPNALGQAVYGRRIFEAVKPYLGT